MPSRRGFLKALLAAPLAGRLLPPAGEPLTAAEQFSVPFTWNPHPKQIEFYNGSRILLCSGYLRSDHYEGLHAATRLPSLPATQDTEE